MDEAAFHNGLFSSGFIEEQLGATTNAGDGTVDDITGSGRLFGSRGRAAAHARPGAEESR
jgi:hypothetical protein